MAGRFSRISAVGLILAGTVALEGCAPLHLAWERAAEFDSMPARLAGEESALRIRWTESSKTEARLAAHVVVTRHYERVVHASPPRRLVVHGESWTVASLLGVFVLVGIGQAAQGGSYDGAGPAILSVLGGMVGIGVAADVVCFLLSVPPALREGVTEALEDDPPRTVAYTLDQVLPCPRLSLSDPATGARVDFDTLPESGLPLRAETLRAVGFRSAELEFSSGDLRARMTLPADFARSLEGR